mgnify:CR=1 FL=1
MVRRDSPVLESADSPAIIATTAFEGRRRHALHGMIIRSGGKNLHLPNKNTETNQKNNSDNNIYQRAKIEIILNSSNTQNNNNKPLETRA